MSRGQSRRASLVESIANIAVGYGVALATQIIVFPLFGMRVSLAQNVGIGLIFTVVSLVRSYALRRFFNWLHVRRGPVAYVIDAAGCEKLLAEWTQLRATGALRVDEGER